MMISFEKFVDFRMFAFYLKHLKTSHLWLPASSGLDINNYLSVEFAADHSHETMIFRIFCTSRSWLVVPSLPRMSPTDCCFFLMQSLRISNPLANLVVLDTRVGKGSLCQLTALALSIMAQLRVQGVTMNKPRHATMHVQDEDVANQSHTRCCLGCSNQPEHQAESGRWFFSKLKP